MVNAFAQSLPVEVELNRKSVPFPIFDYGNKTVLSDEFMRVFNKNKKGDESPSQEDIEEYLDLYVKFKLKVEEAYARKMDTVPSFIKELAGYRVQLAQPYLTDKTVTARLVRQAYDRSQQEVKASHLLINCALDARPEDSLAAYNKIVDLRNRIVEGEDFGKLATEYSDDPSAKNNQGDLGYFTAFQMIYPFENAAFTQKVGDVSLPVRTQFGYHLVYVQEKRKSLGDILVSHIMMKYYNEDQVDSVKQKIDAVYEKLQSGANWEKTVEEFSDDFNTNSKGGKLSWFNRTTGNIPPEFKNAAYELKNDKDYSQPIKTKFGWHIIRREELKPMPTFEESEDRLRRRVERDSRSELNKEVVVARVKSENFYKEVTGLNAVKDQFSKDLLESKFEKKEGNGAVLFTINKKPFTDSDFYEYVATNQTRTGKTLEQAVSDYYNDFVDKMNLDYEESILEEKYPEFRYIMQEYKDGILLFELTDQEVWSKAVEDTLGMKNYYETKKDDYMWRERVDATIYSCKDEKIAKKASKLVGKGKLTAEKLEKCNEKDPLAITTESKKYEKGKNELLSQIEWKQGVFNLSSENDRAKFVHIKEVIPPMVKPLDENLGQVTSDYQNYLEEKWIERLKIKYPIKVYKDKLKKLYN
jgi:peptidyl-prolyl cis-trans isomerase SurA